MKVWVLGSGSSGQRACSSSAARRRVLVDAGFGTRDAREAARRRSASRRQSIEACIVTHEHTRSREGRRGAARERWGWALYATRARWTRCAGARGGRLRARSTPGATLDASRDDADDVRARRTMRRARSACVVTSTRPARRAVVCTDLGQRATSVRDAVRDVDILVLESNHDEGMLRAGPYPPSVQARIASRDRASDEP